MSEKKSGHSNIEQNNNVVTNGDVVAGNKTNNNFFGSSTTLRRMSTQLKDLYAKDEDYKGFIEKLQKYLTYAENKPVRGVEEKLRAGKREDLIEQAKVLKERFYKKINKHQFSEQAQNLFAHILSQIHSFFNSKVQPLIKANTQGAAIDALIYDELVKTIYNDVGDCGLNIDTEDIRGMLFYLTGNCHLEWE